MHQKRREGRSQRALCARAAAGVLPRRRDAVSHSNYLNPSALIRKSVYALLQGARAQLELQVQARIQQAVRGRGGAAAASG